jgi:CRISPR-associated protein Csd1
MIIQALYQRYVDLADDPKSGVSALYFSAGKVSYLFEIDLAGSLLAVRDLRDLTGKKKLPRILNVPEQSSRSSGINPFFLSDKAEYAIGHYPIMPKETETLKKSSDALKKYEASKALARKVLSGTEDEAARAILSFYDHWDPTVVRDHSLLQDMMEDLDKGIDTNIAFRLHTQTALIHESQAIKTAWIHYREQADSLSEYDAQCLLTGELNVPIARTHDKIKGVRNAQAAGASLVSFNFRSAESYGKDTLQSYNSPVSKTAMFGYITALNHLLASQRNRMWIGDMTVVFWAGKAAVAEEIEPFFAAFFDQSYATAEDTSLTAQLKGVLERARQGARLESNMVPHGDTPFYVLGLSPNNARVAVRFFWKGDFGDLVSKLGEHAADLALSGHEDRHHETPTVYRILSETMRVGGDGKKVGDGAPPLLGGQLFRSIMDGNAYPYSLYVLILNRIRADGIVNHLRVSILKAYLSRYSRIHKVAHIEEGLTLTLDPQVNEPAYRLGRLFAVLERAQQDAASGKLNATIKDRYFSSASSNPGAVFPILIKLAQHHMSKSRYGDFRDREIQEILQGVDGFPSNLDLNRQGIFILGYYHQKQDFFTQIKAASEAKLEAAAANES